MNKSDRTIVHQKCNAKMEGMGIFFEVDGDTHFTADQMVYDAARTAWLGEQGCRGVRFTNDDVMENVEEVLETIMERCP